jgi:hypothetical protein
MSSVDTRDRSRDPHRESEAERDDRNLAELLQELRVAGLGVQVLFGFLLSLPFTHGFPHLSQGQLFAGLWFALPLARRQRAGQGRERR